MDSHEAQGEEGTRPADELSDAAAAAAKTALSLQVFCSSLLQTLVEVTWHGRFCCGR